ncbi:hypothetical protein TNCV_368231 [Trichonephila clavipes]|nr:hypothetical protein TNCV_368231 [Trichonephila clavipes]
MSLKRTHFPSGDEITQNVTAELNTIPKEVFYKFFQQSCTRAIDDGPRNLNHSEVTRTTPDLTPHSPNLCTIPMGGCLSLDRFNVKRAPFVRSQDKSIRQASNEVPICSGLLVTDLCHVTRTTLDLAPLYPNYHTMPMSLDRFKVYRPYTQQWVFSVTQLELVTIRARVLDRNY